MAKITAYDAMGFGLSMGLGTLTIYPDGVDYKFNSSNTTLGPFTDLGNGYATYSAFVTGCPYLDEIAQYARKVGDTVYILSSRFINHGVTFLTEEDTYLTGAQLSQGNTVLCSGNDTIIGNRFGDSIGGYTGADNLYGRAGNDRLRGDAGNDKLFGGLDNDFLTGGAGNDRFVFDTALGAGNLDTVSDFAKGIDKIVLDDDIFSRFFGTSAGVGLQAFNYKIGQPADGNDYLIYNTFTDKLSYDDDGSGPHVAIPFATIPLSGTMAPAFTDFLLVA